MAGTQPSPPHLVEEEQKKETAGHWGRPGSQRIMLQCQGSQMEPEPNIKWACSSRSYVWVARKELTSQTHTQIHSPSLPSSLPPSFPPPHVYPDWKPFTHTLYLQSNWKHINESNNRDCVWPSASPHLRSSGLPLILGKHALPHTPTCSHGWFKASSVVNLDFGSTTNSFLTRSRAKKAENWENHNEKNEYISPVFSNYVRTTDHQPERRAARSQPIWWRELFKPLPLWMQRTGTLWIRIYPIIPCWDITIFWLLLSFLAAVIEFRLIKTELLPSYEILRMHQLCIPLLDSETRE